MHKHDFCGEQSIYTRAILANKKICMHDFFCGGTWGHRELVGGHVSPRPPVATPLVTRARFHAWGILPVFSNRLIICVMGSTMHSIESFMILVGISSRPVALFLAIPFTHFKTSDCVISLKPKLIWPEPCIVPCYHQISLIFFRLAAKSTKWLFRHDAMIFDPVISSPFYSQLLNGTDIYFPR